MRDGPVSVDWGTAEVVPPDPWGDDSYTLRLRVSPTPDPAWLDLLEDISAQHNRPWSAARSESGQSRIQIAGVLPGQEADVRTWVDGLLIETNQRFASKVHAVEAREMTERFRRTGEE